jgi:transcriptional regulator with XRE-family HTH domain
MDCGKKLQATEGENVSRVAQAHGGKGQGTIRNMALDELRAARHLTQAQLAQALGIKQAGVSRFEKRTDLYVSTLRRVVEAMGGELEIRAIFPDHGTVRISNFVDVGEREEEARVAEH